MVTATPNPTLIAFIGDLHGKLAAFEHTTAQALNRGATTIIQVGDFWIYDNPRQLAKLQRVLRRISPDGIADEDIDYRFIDGNHEKFDILNPDATAPVAMSDNLTYMPRGTHARLAGADILFFGGASSVDRDHRTEGTTWWPAENITAEQVQLVTDTPTAPVDILVTHDTSTAGFAALLDHGGHARDKTDDPAGTTNRAYLDTVITHTRPRVQVHGHHHTRHTTTHTQAGHPLTTIALNLEKARGSVILCDTTDWSWTIPVGRKDTGADEHVTPTPAP
ncbi:metallophosphoesterase [Corynebacterium sp.]|uniref:metallophosphoesterase n=1 Tax=Corynebacterium sp. TaxID=1720 RepID=UPI0025C3E6BB|nr:metallophosphoesterase [Corynebacterium sp.]